MQGGKVQQIFPQKHWPRSASFPERIASHVGWYDKAQASSIKNQLPTNISSGLTGRWACARSLGLTK
jgi:hypothetical protein